MYWYYCFFCVYVGLDCGFCGVDWWCSVFVWLLQCWFGFGVDWLGGVDEYVWFCIWCVVVDQCGILYGIGGSGVGIVIEF